MKLKCFGGPLDKQYCDVPNDECIQGEYYQIYKMPLASVKDFDPNKAPEITTINRYFYVIEIIRVKKHRFFFLRYNEIAIEELFTKIFT